ncbi:hypothetical protein CBR_g66341, partial [Chara braunii]
SNSVDLSMDEVAWDPAPWCAFAMPQHFSVHFAANEWTATDETLTFCGSSCVRLRGGDGELGDGWGGGQSGSGGRSKGRFLLPGGSQEAVMNLNRPTVCLRTFMKLNRLTVRLLRSADVKIFCVNIIAAFRRTGNMDGDGSFIDWLDGWSWYEHY